MWNDEVIKEFVLVIILFIVEIVFVCFGVSFFVVLLRIVVVFILLNMEEVFFIIVVLDRVKKFENGLSDFNVFIFVLMLFKNLVVRIDELIVKVVNKFGDEDNIFVDKFNCGVLVVFDVNWSVVRFGKLFDKILKDEIGEIGILKDIKNEDVFDIFELFICEIEGGNVWDE